MLPIEVLPLYAEQSCQRGRDRSWVGRRAAKRQFALPDTLRDLIQGAGNRLGRRWPGRLLARSVGVPIGGRPRIRSFGVGGLAQRRRCPPVIPLPVGFPPLSRGIVCWCIRGDGRFKWTVTAGRLICFRCGKVVDGWQWISEVL